MSCCRKGAVSTPTESPTNVTWPTIGGGGALACPTVAPVDVEPRPGLGFDFGFGTLVDGTVVVRGGGAAPIAALTGIFAALAVVQAAATIGTIAVTAHARARRRVARRRRAGRSVGAT